MPDLKLRIIERCSTRWITPSGCEHRCVDDNAEHRWPHRCKCHATAPTLHAPALLEAPVADHARLLAIALAPICGGQLAPILADTAIGSLLQLGWRPPGGTVNDALA